MADDPDPGHMIHFCREILPGMLVEACGVAATDARLVAKDVLLRAEAAARLDPASREALAAPFYEESYSHEPDEAPTWMKAITTLVIRNSHLEEVHTNGPVTTGGITGITTYGLGPLSHLIAARRRERPRMDARDDPLAGLAELYPRAWACLNALRTSLNSGGGRAGYRQPEAPIPGLPDISEVTEAPPADDLELTEGFKGVIFSGIDPRFDQNSFELLKAAEGGEFLVMLSSLSRISRNSHKLLRVLEFLLAHQARILTTNYLLTGKEVWVRRRELVKPDSGTNPIDGLRNLSGLSGVHKKTVESYIRQVEQNREQLLNRAPSGNVCPSPAEIVRPGH